MSLARPASNWRHTIMPNSPSPSGRNIAPNALTGHVYKYKIYPYPVSISIQMWLVCCNLICDNFLIWRGSWTQLMAYIQGSSKEGSAKIWTQITIFPLLYISLVLVRFTFLYPTWGSQLKGGKINSFVSYKKTLKWDS